jgi:phosphorylase/glycogen(starch) synthase
METTENIQKLRPDYIFEVSWEVCNKVGGIHTVISTKTLSLVKEWGDNYILVGPDVWKGSGEHPEFSEDPTLFVTWKEHLEAKGLKVRMGRWRITGNPIVVLIDFTSLFSKKDDIFKNLWLDFQVDSLSGQWDYTEPTLFGYAAGMLIECFYDCHLTLSDQIVAHFHEWLTAAGVLYLERKVPQIATVFTTHATITGRTIAGNDLPFYSQFDQFKADQEAKKWNIISKHSLEKAGAKYTDCFTTVSALTARECKHFLGRLPDVLTPNGFDNTIVPDSYHLRQKRDKARKKLLQVAEAISGNTFPEDSLLLLKSGRYEFRNKGIDIFIEALNKLKNDPELKKKVVAFICVPGHHTGPKESILKILNGEEAEEDNKFLSHHLQGVENDPIMKLINKLGIKNNANDTVNVFFVPVYLDGIDGIFNMSYYDLLPGFDLSAFPSYYEPWGYTPLESLAFNVPTITTDVTGFGQFIKEFNTGVYVLHRDDINKEEVIGEIASIISRYSKKNKKEIELSREAAFALSKVALWKNLISYYKEAYSIALVKSRSRIHLFDHKPLISPLETEREAISLSNEPNWKRIFIQPTFPKELKPLEELSKNLWWSWNEDAIGLFRSIDPFLWEESKKNPIALLSTIPLVNIKRMLRDQKFLNRLNTVYKEFTDYMSKKPQKKEISVAYFCMEYGLENNLKLYSGGLGILAGDYLKEASDSNKNIIGVGLLYRKGYFKQQLSLYGDQLNDDDVQKFTHLPLEPVRKEDEEWLKISIAFPGRTLFAKIWRVPVGRTSLYLLDTDISENRKEDLMITDHLYAGDTEYRLKQELLLGIGGVRMLHALNIHPDVYHCNEGHAAFMGLERLYRHILKENIDFNQALELIKASTLFTTHTPVDAGHDRFSEELLRTYISHYTETFNISWQRLMAMGRSGNFGGDEKFSMSFFAARIAQEINGVSELNERVSRKIFHKLWKNYTLSELHIGHVTNAIHYDTWTSPEWKTLYENELGKPGVENICNEEYWKKILQIEDWKIWEAHRSAKVRLIEKIIEKSKENSPFQHSQPAKVNESVENLNEDALIIGFARRFVPYKRATLLFKNLHRLSRLLKDKNRPMIILFAGKAHPTDLSGQRLIKMIVSIAFQEEFLGKIIFIENYDMDIAKHLVQGVDIWLNTPERGMEASGTSGMKAAFNGVLNFSILDGWWNEAYDKECGWAIESNNYHEEEYINQADAEDIYNKLEREILPLFFKREEGLPVEWIRKMKNSIAKLGPVYNSKRMLNDYFNKYYLKLNHRSHELAANNFEKIKELCLWKNEILEEWPHIRVESIRTKDTMKKALTLGDNYHAEIEVFLDGIDKSEVAVEIVFIEKRENMDEDSIIFVKELPLVKEKGNIGVYSYDIPLTKPGVYEHSFRIYPKHPLLANRQDFPLIKWA